jgi:cytochrome P450
MSVSTPAPPDILSPEHARNPYETYRILLEDFPVHYHEGTKTWLVSRHEDVAAILRSRQIGSENYTWQLEPVHGRTVIQMEGKEHTSNRALLSPFFHGDGLGRFEQTVVDTAHNLSEPFLAREEAAVKAGDKQRGEVDIAFEFTRLFPVSVTVEMLGLPHDDLEKFERWYVSIINFLANLDGAQEPIDAGLRTRQELGEYLLPIIAERRGGQGEDLISLFTRAEVEGERLSDDDIRGFVSFILAAGGETTDRGLASMFSHLLRAPEQLPAVYENRDLIEDAFAETLRFAPPVHMIMRTVLEPLEVQGVTIPAGSTVTCLLGAANRDPRKFADPDTFDIFRTDNDTRRAFRGSADHLAFAGGRHFCVGAMLARSEVRVGANLILDRMQDLRLAEQNRPSEEGVFMRGPNHVHVTYVPA